MSLRNRGSNTGVNFGHSSRLGYDVCAYPDRLNESVGPMLYKLNPDQMYNCNECISYFGPRSSYNGFGVGTLGTGDPYATAQNQVDVESILSNRNLPLSRCKTGEINPINVTRFRLNHPRTCNNFLDPIASHLTNPPATYREMAIDRFYDLPTQPQANIFYNFAVNTQLEAKDNYRERIPNVIKYDRSLPRAVNGCESLN